MKENILVIAAVRSDADFEKALKSGVRIIFDLHPNVLTVAVKIKKAHQNGKKYFVHLDLAEGIGKDKGGVEFVKRQGADGIISTRVNIVKLAREVGIFSVQRFFAVDSKSVETTLESLKASKPDMIEIMPGVLQKVIRNICKGVNIPVIAGGLVETEDEVRAAIDSGAAAISTGAEELWNN